MNSLQTPPTWYKLNPFTQADIPLALDPPGKLRASAPDLRGTCLSLPGTSPKPSDFCPVLPGTCPRLGFNGLLIK